MILCIISYTNFRENKLMKKATSNKLLYAFSALVLLLAIAATVNNTKRQSKRPPVTISQNPVPACPPVCNDPDAGPDTTAKR